MKLNRQRHLMLTVAFGESTMSKTQVQLWYNQFKDISDDVRPGRPSSSTADENIEAMKKMILDNRQITIREFADDVDISFVSCQAIFTNVLGMKGASAKIVSELQNFKKNQLRMDMSQEMLTTFNEDPVLHEKVITVDESWVYVYDIESKAKFNSLFTSIAMA